MKPLTPEQKTNFQSMIRQYPEFGEYVKAWRTEELENLLFTHAEKVGVQQGRTQALTELQRKILGLD